MQHICCIADSDKCYKEKENKAIINTLVFILLESVLMFFLFIFGHIIWHARSQFQESNPGPLQWKCGVLTTGPPGKSNDLHTLTYSQS